MFVIFFSFSKFVIYCHFFSYSIRIFIFYPKCFKFISFIPFLKRCSQIVLGSGVTKPGPTLVPTPLSQHHLHTELFILHYFCLPIRSWQSLPKGFLVLPFLEKRDIPWKFSLGCWPQGSQAVVLSVPLCPFVLQMGVGGCIITAFTSSHLRHVIWAESQDWLWELVP